MLANRRADASPPSRNMDEWNHCGASAILLKSVTHGTVLREVSWSPTPLRSPLAVRYNAASAGAPRAPSLPPFKRLFHNKDASPQLRSIRLAVPIISKRDNSIEGKTVKVHIMAGQFAAIRPANRLQRGYRYGQYGGHQSGCVAGTAIISYLAA